jgi:hypothetical protein
MIMGSVIRDSRVAGLSGIEPARQAASANAPGGAVEVCYVEAAKFSG